MRRAWIAVLAALIFSLPAAAAVAADATTKPPAELAKENAELRAYVEKLEAQIAALRAELKAKEKALPPRAEALPRPPAPYGYSLPVPPFKIPTPAPAPSPSLPRFELRVPTPGQSVPDNWVRRRFNGQEFYLVPLK